MNSTNIILSEMGQTLKNIHTFTSGQTTGTGLRLTSTKTSKARNFREMQMLPNWVGRGGEVAIGKGEAWCRGFGVSAVLSLDQDGGLRAASGCANPLRGMTAR